MRVAPPVELSPEERTRLLRIRLEGNVRGLRAAIVLLASEGMRDDEIGRRLHVNRQTAARWRRRFLASRARALDETSVAIRVGRIPGEKLQAIVRATLGRRASGGRPWSTRRLAREFGVSHMTVRRLWDAYGIRPVRFEPFPPRADPTRPSVAWDVVGLYLGPPQAALVVTLHPSVVPVNDRVSARPASGWAPPEPESRGAGLGLSAAFQSLAPGVSPAQGEESRGRELLGFLTQIAARLPARPPVRLLVTGIPTVGPALFARWQVRHPSFEVEPARDLVAWKARAIRELSAIGRGPTPRRQFRGRAELTGSLARSLASYVEGSGPFEWLAPKRGIADGESAYRLRYDLAVTGHTGFKPAALLPPTMTRESNLYGKYRASARMVLRQNLAVRPGERVTVESWTGTLDYANAFILETLRIGARPLLLYQDEPTYWAAATEVPAKSLAQIGDHRKAALERTDVFVSFFGPSDRERFHALPSPTLFRLGEYQDAMYQAAAKAGARTVQMAIGRVSDASARMYGVDEVAWRQELLEGSLVPRRTLHRRGEILAERLQRGNELEIRHANGTELKLRLRHRKAFVSDGTVRRARPREDWSMVTLPAGVITVPVDEGYAEGSFRSNVRSSVGLSDSVGWFAGGRWTFVDGRLRSFAYDEGQDLFAQSYRRAGDGRDRPASVSIGLNERIAASPLLEDQGLGTVTFNVGRNDYLGGKTRSGWWAWLCQRGSTVSVDGKTIVRRGKLVP